MIIFFRKRFSKKKLVIKLLKSLKKNNYIQEGIFKPPKGEEDKKLEKNKRLIFKSVYLAMMQIELYKKTMDHGHILLMT